MTNGTDVNQNDKLWALFCWLPWVGWILDIIALLIEPQKKRPFIRYNAVQALIANVILAILSAVLSPTCVGSLIVLVLWLATFYYCIKSYGGDWVEVPFITNFCKNQGWI